MSSKRLSSIYGKNRDISKLATQTPSPELKNDGKAANRVLAGMKIQNSHMRVLNVDGNNIEVPKMEYVHLLDKQVRDTRQTNNDLQARLIKAENVINNLYNEIRDLKNTISQIPSYKFNKRK